MPWRETGGGFETTAAEVSRNFGHWQDRAMQGPVTVTHHGRPRVVILSADEYERLAGAADRPTADRSGDGSSEAALQSLLSGMTEGFLGFDPRLRITAANNVAQAYLGRTESQLLGNPLYPPEYADRGAVMIDRLRWVQRTGESVSFETGSLLREGRHLLSRAFPYRDGVGVIFTNITQLTALRAEQAAWRAERHALAQHPAVSLASLNVLGFFVDANAAFESFIGFSAAQLADVRLGDLAAPAARHELAQGLNQLLQQKTEVYHAELEFLTRERGRRSLKVAFSRRMRDAVCEGFAMVALPGEP